MQNSPFNRSILLYAVIFIFLGRCVDWEIPKRQHEHYLLGIFSNGGFQNFYDGILYFDSMITHYPDSAENYAGLGSCYFNLGKYDKSIAAFQRAISLNPESEYFQQLLRLAEQKSSSGNGPPLLNEQIRLELK